eukprot:COSAG01_NODE_12461_length_1734_cov_19.441590_1_plen_24_part_10
MHQVILVAEPASDDVRIDLSFSSD